MVVLKAPRSWCWRWCCFIAEDNGKEEDPLLRFLTMSTLLLLLSSYSSSFFIVN